MAERQRMARIQVRLEQGTRDEVLGFASFHTIKIAPVAQWLGWPRCWLVRSSGLIAIACRR